MPGPTDLRCAADEKLTGGRNRKLLKFDVWRTLSAARQNFSRDTGGRLSWRPRRPYHETTSDFDGGLRCSFPLDQRDGGAP